MKSLKVRKTVNLSQKIEPDLSEKLVRAARDLRVNKSVLVREAIAQYLKNIEDQNSPTAA